MQNEAKGRIWGIIVLALGLSVFLRLSPWLLACWLTGAGCYFANEKIIRKRFMVIWLLIAVMGCIASQLQTDASSFGPIFLSGYMPSRDIAWVIESFGIGLFIASMVKVVPSTPWLVKFERVGPKLSSFSYTLYLSHFPTMALWEHFGPAKYAALTIASLTFFALKIASSLAVALLLYVLFESQTPRVRIWFRNLFIPNFIAKANQG